MNLINSYWKALLAVHFFNQYPHIFSYFLFQDPCINLGGS
jgi:hypothetical protein